VPSERKPALSSKSAVVIRQEVSNLHEKQSPKKILSADKLLAVLGGTSCIKNNSLRNTKWYLNLEKENQKWCRHME
jgi:hypothetical protein